MTWQLHEPGQAAELNVDAGERVYHTVIWFDEHLDPLHAEVSARDVDHARERCDVFSRIPGRTVVAVEVFTLEEWVTRDPD